MQRLADGLTAARVEALLRKWLARLPHPFSANDREQGIRYDLSILQAEFARTEVITDGVIPSLHVDYKHSRDQAVPQGGARAAHRDGHQRHVRLRCRSPAEEPR